MMPKLLASYVLFPFVGRKNMPGADARTQNAQYLDVADDQSAARELQERSRSVQGAHFQSEPACIDRVLEALLEHSSDGRPGHHHLPQAQ